MRHKVGADLYLKKHTPKTVFKYRAGCKNDKGKINDIDALINQYLWEPNAFNLNDPYDCVIRMEYDSAIMNLLNVSKDEMMQVDKKMLEKELEKVSDKWRKQWHIISFSERVDSILMWSHYANEHKGFCIEYNTDDFISTLQPIIYSNVFENIIENMDAAPCAVMTKAKDWEYEREWRIIDQTIDEIELGGFKYLAPKPSAIYLGCRIDMNMELKDEILAYAKSEKIKLYQMQLRKDSYMLEAVDITEINVC